MVVSTMDIAWVAGLLEGEGCFSVNERRAKGRTYKRVFIQTVMTDRDVMQRLASLMGGHLCEMPWRGLMTKPTYRLYIGGARAAAWMMTVLPLMGARRAAKIVECLGVWKGQPGRIHYVMGGSNR